MPKERSSFTPPVEPISPPPKPARAHWPGFGGGAGYRPRVRRAYSEAVYPHSRSRQQSKYKHFAELYKSCDKLSFSRAGDWSLNRLQTFVKAEPYGVLGLFLSLLAIAGLTSIFCCLGALATIGLAAFFSESEFFNSIMTLLKIDHPALSPEAEIGLGFAISYAIYGGLGLSTLLVAFVRARSAEINGKSRWDRMKDLTALVRPILEIRLLFIAFVAFLYGLSVDLLLPRFYPPAADWVTLPQGRGQIAALFILVAAVAPVVEELLFRGWIFTSLRGSCGFWTALLGTSALFAFLHYEQTHFYALAVFPLGLALGLMREWSGSIKPGVAFHAFYNLTVLTLGLLD